jgi:hypothetical protein
MTGSVKGGDGFSPAFGPAAGSNAPAKIAAVKKRIIEALT